MPKTQHETLIAALESHGCQIVGTLPSGWTKWTEGSLVTSRPTTDGQPRFFYLGRTNSLRHGRTRTTSVEWPKTRNKLLAEGQRRMAKTPDTSPGQDLDPNTLGF